MPLQNNNYFETIVPLESLSENACRNPTKKVGLRSLSHFIALNYNVVFVQDPSLDPTIEPSYSPTVDPSFDPTLDPSIDPTLDPSVDPTIEPSYSPTVDPSLDPTFDPTIDPSLVTPTKIDSILVNSEFYTC